MTVQEIRDFMSEHKVKIVSREKSWLMRAIGWFLSITHINSKFMTSYFTTIGRTIYAPNFLNVDEYFRVHANTFEHEFVHIKQREKWGLLYDISYIFLPVPFGLAWFRWRWEREAYLTNIKNGDSIDWVVQSLSNYGWPWPKKWMRRWFERNGGK